jgi:hypothetical protein
MAYEQTEESKATLAQMDAAAAEAAKEIPITGTAVELLQWYKKWHMKAGYKRLGKLMKALV